MNRGRTYDEEEEEKGEAKRGEAERKRAPERTAQGKKKTKRNPKQEKKGEDLQCLPFQSLGRYADSSHRSPCAPRRATCRPRCPTPPLFRRCVANFVPTKSDQIRPCPMPAHHPLADDMRPLCSCEGSCVRGWKGACIRCGGN